MQAHKQMPNSIVIKKTLRLSQTKLLYKTIMYNCIMYFINDKQQYDPSP